MDIETSKNLGGVGAVLLALGPLLFFGISQVESLFGIGGLLIVIGVVLILIALKGLSDYFNEAGILNNALYGLVTIIAGGFVSAGVMIGVLFSSLSEWITDPLNPNEWATAFTDWSIIFSLIGAVVLALVLLYIFSIISAVLYRKSFSTLATSSGVGMFSTAGLLILIGAIIPFIGLILIWIAIILLAVAFFSLRRTPVQPSQPAAEPTTTPSAPS
jgi:uncharacterized membrane protein